MGGVGEERGSLAHGVMMIQEASSKKGATGPRTTQQTLECGA